MGSGPGLAVVLVGSSSCGEWSEWVVVIVGSGSGELWSWWIVVLQWAENGPSV